MASNKHEPVYSGPVNYFPRTLRALSRLCRAGNDKHNPGQPLHWAKDKSTDHPDCMLRHSLTPYAADSENGNERHVVAVAWRAMAWAEIALEATERGICTWADLESGRVNIAELGAKIVTLNETAVPALLPVKVASIVDEAQSFYDTDGEERVGRGSDRFLNSEAVKTIQARHLAAVRKDYDEEFRKNKDGLMRGPVVAPITLTEEEVEFWRSEELLRTGELPALDVDDDLLFPGEPWGAV